MTQITFEISTPIQILPKLLGKNCETLLSPSYLVPSFHIEMRAFYLLKLLLAEVQKQGHKV
jgi:hypothetical protein